MTERFGSVKNKNYLDTKKKRYVAFMKIKNRTIQFTVIAYNRSNARFLAERSTVETYGKNVKVHSMQIMELDS